MRPYEKMVAACIKKHSGCSPKAKGQKPKAAVSRNLRLSAFFLRLFICSLSLRIEASFWLFCQKQRHSYFGLYLRPEARSQKRLFWAVRQKLKAKSQKRLLLLPPRYQTFSTIQLPLKINLIQVISRYSGKVLWNWEQQLFILKMKSLMD